MPSTSRLASPTARQSSRFAHASHNATARAISRRLDGRVRSGKNRSCRPRQGSVPSSRSRASGSRPATTGRVVASAPTTRLVTQPTAHSGSRCRSVKHCETGKQPACLPLARGPHVDRPTARGERGEHRDDPVMPVQAEFDGLAARVHGPINRAVQTPPPVICVGHLGQPPHSTATAPSAVSMLRLAAGSAGGASA